MLRLILLGAQVLVLALAAYNLITALWGLPTPPPGRPGPRRRRFRVVIPAHNEALVIGDLLGDLAAQDYSGEMVDVWVLADRCTDETVAAVGDLASVAERHRGQDGKGALLGWYLERFPLDADEALVVLDADNRVPPELLSRFADEMDAGNDVLQAYLDVVSPDESILATAGALSYWASNRMVQLARHNLGWSADLGGTGMAFSSRAIAASSGFSNSLTEDQEMSARMTLAGFPVTWLHDVRVKDQKPATLGVTVRQRARWMSGKRSVARRYGLRLLGRTVSSRSLAAFDMAVRLAQPSRSFMVLVALTLAVAQLVSGTDLLFSFWLWLIVVAVQVLVPVAFLALEGVPGKYLLRYPLLVIFALVWLPARVVSQLVRSWYHTPHRR